MNLKLNYSWLVFVFFFFFSLFFSNLYYGGDQLFYHKLYYEIPLNFTLAFLRYQQILNPIEIFYFFFIYIGALFDLDKNLYISFFNAIMYTCAFKIIYKLYNSKRFAFCFIISCFYLHVLAFSAERFKFSMLFVFLALLLSSNYKKYVVLISSIFFHVQSFVLVSALSVLFKNFIIKYKFSIIFSSFLLVFFFFNNFEYLNYKFQQYNEDAGFSSVFKTYVFFILSCLDLKRIPRKFVFFSVIAAACFFVGDERLNIFSFFGCIYFASFYTRRLLFFLIPLYLYMLYKSIFFFYLIITTGNGFDVL